MVAHLTEEACERHVDETRVVESCAENADAFGIRIPAGDDVGFTGAVVHYQLLTELQANHAVKYLVRFAVPAREVQQIDLQYAPNLALALERSACGTQQVKCLPRLSVGHELPHLGADRGIKAR